MQKITESENNNIVSLIGDMTFDANKIIDFYGEQLDSLKKYCNYNDWLKIIANAFFCSLVIKNNKVKNKQNINTNEIIGSLFEETIYQKIDETLLYNEQINFNIIFKIIKENLCGKYLELV